MAFLIVAGMAAASMAVSSIVTGKPKSIAENYTDDLMKVTSTVINKVAADCASYQGSAQTVRFSGHCEFTGKIKQKQVTAMSVSCLQKAKVKTDISTEVTREFMQKAESEAAALAMVEGSNESRNFLNLHTELATAITNSFSQNCATSTNQAQGVICEEYAKVKDIYIQQDQMSQSWQKCTQEATIVNTIITKIQEEINQRTKSVSALGSILKTAGVIFAVCLIIYLIYKFTSKSKEPAPATTIQFISPTPPPTLATPAAT